MVELYINDELVELKGDEDIAVEYKIFDIKNIGTRSGARSFTFNIPKTNRNKEIFENPEIINNQSNFPYTRFKVRCYVNGVDTLILFGEIQSAKEYYVMRVYGTNTNIFDLIRDESIKTLDLSQYNHTRDLFQIISSKDNVEGYIYPIIDFHADSPNAFLPGGAGQRKCAAEYMLPCTFVITILRKIFESIGYGMDLTEYNDEQVVLCPTTNVSANSIPRSKYNGVFRCSQDITFDNIIVSLKFTPSAGTVLAGDRMSTTDITPLTAKGTALTWSYNNGVADLTMNKWNGEAFTGGSSIFIESGGGTMTISVIGSNPAPSLSQPVSNKFATIDTIVNYSGNYFIMPSPNNVAFAFEDDIPFTIVITVVVRNTSNFPSKVAVIVKSPIGDLSYAAQRIDVAPNTTTVQTVTVFTGQMLDRVNGSGQSEFKMRANGGNVSIGYRGYNDEVTVLNTTTYEIISDFEGEHPLPWVYDTRVELNATLPNIGRLEFVKIYCQLYCLLMFVDEVNKVVKFVPFNTIKNNLFKAYDWSAKIDYSEEPEVKFILDGYTRNNKFTYTQEGDIKEQDAPEFELKPEGTDGAIIINNQNLEAESDYVDLPFAATLDVRRFISASGGTFIPPIMINHIGLFMAGEFENEKEPRILIIDRTEFVSGDPIIEITVEPSSSVSVSGFPVTRFIHAVGRNNAGDPGRAYNLGWGNSMLPLFYNQINDILNKAKLLTILVRLNISDINQLDFTKPVYIDKYEAYFYISSVKDFSFTDSGSTLVELVKLNIHG